MESMQVFERGDDGILRIRPDDVADVQGTIEPTPERQGRSRLNTRGAQQGTQHEIDVSYLS